MAMRIAFLLFDFQCLVILIALIVSLLNLKKGKSKEINWLILYNLVAVIVMIPFFLMTHNLLFLSSGNRINNFSLIFNCVFLNFFMINNMPDKKGKKLLFIVSILFVCLITFLLLRDDKNTFHTIPFGFNQVSLLFTSSIFIYKLFKNIPDRNLFKYPFFWIVIGVFICSIITFPVFLLAEYLIETNSLFQSNYFLANITIIGYILMHLFFIKAALCSIKK